MSTFRTSLTTAVICLAAFASADFTEKATYSVDTTYDRSIQPILVNQFNPALGTLKAIRLRYYQRLNGTLNYEIANPNPSPIGEWTGIQPITARVEVTFPDGGLGVKYTQAISFVKAFEGSKFDGFVDFDGTSGGAALISATGGGVGPAPAYYYRIQNPAVLLAMTGVGSSLVTLKNSVSMGPISWLAAPNPYGTYTELNLGGSTAAIGVIYEYSPIFP